MVRSATSAPQEHAWTPIAAVDDHVLDIAATGGPACPAADGDCSRTVRQWGGIGCDWTSGRSAWHRVEPAARTGDAERRRAGMNRVIRRSAVCTGGIIALL